MRWTDRASFERVWWLWLVLAVALGGGLLLAVQAWAYDDVIGVQYVRCHDGDTCTVNIAHVPDVFGRNISVRLTGIDTPELGASCIEARRLAKSAKELLIRHLQGAKAIALQNPKRDKYFRLNATMIADGVNLNQVLLDLGLAVPYDGGTKTHHWCP